MKRSSLMTFSVVAHVAVAVGLGAIQVRKSHTPTVVELVDVKKPKPEPEQKPPPPEPPKPKASSAPKPSRARSLSNAPSPKLASADARGSGFDGVPDFGVALSGGGEGLAIAIAEAAPEPAIAPPKALSVPRVAAKKPDACTTTLRKPVPLSVPKPEYPSGVRDFSGSGKVRIKLTVDQEGRVVSAEILSGMRDEFNEAALAAARRARFEPGTQCGNPVTASFTIAMRFSSG